MNELRMFIANMYFISAKFARWSAVGIGVCGFAYGFMANGFDIQIAGWSAAQLFTIGIVGPVVFFAISVGCEMAGNSMQRSVEE